MKTLRIGNFVVTMNDGWSITSLPSGEIVDALHALQPGQEEIAKELGMSVEEMNRTHDLTHALLCHWLGLQTSPALTEGGHLGDLEEGAVLAIQAFAKAAGADLVAVAERLQA